MKKQKDKPEELAPVFFDRLKKIEYKLIKSEAKSTYYSASSFKPEPFYKPIVKL